MKNAVAALIAAIYLCGCGIIGKLDAVSNLETSSASYKACLAEHEHDVAPCEARRVTYQIGLSEAQRTRGMLTNWPRI
jgi:hypothetical protein